MKKYFFTFIIALIIGFFLCIFFLRQYKDFSGIKVSNYSEKLYFVQFGVFSSLNSLEENTTDLVNYVYTKQGDLYYVFVGITALKENAQKIVNYYKSIGYDAIIKEYEISNKGFIKELANYDELLKNTSDNKVISSIISQVISKYEEVVISGGKN